MWQSIVSFLNSVWPYLVAIAAFLFLIIIHEFGHFIAAKTLGVRVNEFAVGFGPTIFRKKGKETEYSLRLVPLGGFCAMEGEDETSTDERAFCNKAAWRRFLIVVMGAVFNLIFGVVIIAVSFIPQTQFATTKVAYFADTATSNSAGGLQLDDEIIEIEGRNIYTVNDLAYNFTAVDDGKINMTVIRNGEKVRLTNVPFATELYDLNGKKYNIITLDFKVYPEQKNFVSYITQTGKTALSYSQTVIYTLVDLIGGRYGMSEISGPVGVTVALGEAAKTGIFDLLPMIALITINLGIFNLLPIPALDGGRLVFILIEMIFRKPVPVKYEKWVHAAGLFILLLFMAFVMVKDIWMLF